MRVQACGSARYARHALMTPRYVDDYMRDMLKRREDDGIEPIDTREDVAALRSRGGAHCRCRHYAYATRCRQRLLLLRDDIVLCRHDADVMRHTCCHAAACFTLLCAKAFVGTILPLLFVYAYDDMAPRFAATQTCAPAR